MSLEQALVRRNEELEEKNLVLEDQVAALKETLASSVEVPDLGYLTGMQRKLFRLMPIYPKFVSRESLMVGLYGDRKNPPGEKTIDAHMCHMRATLAARRCPFWVQTIYGGGYTLHRVTADFWDKTRDIQLSRMWARSPEEICSDLVGAENPNTVPLDRLRMPRPALPSFPRAHHHD